MGLGPGEQGEGQGVGKQRNGQRRPPDAAGVRAAQRRQAGAAQIGEPQQEGRPEAQPDGDHGQRADALERHRGREKGAAPDQPEKGEFQPVDRMHHHGPAFVRKCEGAPIADAPCLSV